LRDTGQVIYTHPNQCGVCMPKKKYIVSLKKREYLEN